MSGNSVGQPRPLDSLVTVQPDIPLGMSADGRVLFVYVDIGDSHGDIYESHRIGNYFSKPRKLRGEINSYSRDGRCALSPDGRTLYFSSDRPGGKGGKDIYRASLSADSTWGNVVNLGDSVNTQYDEDAPFVLADGVTLYFSSQGHGSIGDLDIFRTTMNPADSTFRKPVSLGAPLNTPADESDLVVAADGTHGFYRAARSKGKGMNDIYRVDFSGQRPVAAVLLKGKSTGEQGPLLAAITASSAPGKVYSTTYPRMNGEYSMLLTAGKSYTVSCSPEGMSPKDFVVDLTSFDRFEERTMDFRFEKFKLPEPVAASAHTVASPPATNTVATVTKTNTVAPPAAAPATVAAVASRPPAPPVRKSDKDGFIPHNKLQEKTMLYVEKYGDISSPGLEFRVQMSAVKNKGDKSKFSPSKYGRIDQMQLGDGFTRITAGGSFKTIRKAFEMNKRVVRAGYTEAFVIAVYKGRRVQFQELEQNGIFK